VKEPGCDANGIQLEVREDVGDFERVDQIRLSGLADLPAVLPGRKQISPPEQVLIGAGMVAAHLFDDCLKSDHCSPNRHENDAKTKGGAPRKAATYDLITEEKTNSL